MPTWCLKVMHSGLTPTGIDSWAQDLADIGPIYPFQGTGFILVVVAVVAWLAWHIVQIKSEQNEQRETAQIYGSPKIIKRSLDND